MSTKQRYVFLGLFAACLAALGACEADDAAPSKGAGDEEAAADSDTDTDADVDTDNDTDVDSDTDLDMDADGDADEGDGGPIIPDCTNCPGVGTDLNNLLCAVDLCDPDNFVSQEVGSPTGANPQGAYQAVERFGSANNDLAPLLNGSYALLATGRAVGVNHQVDLAGSAGNDPFANDSSREIYDAVEWRLRLKAPEGAHGIQIHYVFFSAEYDEYVGSQYNDKFYIFLEAPSTNSNQRTVINFTECRGGYNGDKVCDQALEDLGLCNVGDKLCYIAINTALSECCWYKGCPDGTWTTDITGTGFTCAQSMLLDSASKGSSTGWLKTEWPLEPNEEFTLIFHIHDTSDHWLDSEVILDRIVFVGKADPGTVPIE